MLLLLHKITGILLKNYKSKNIKEILAYIPGKVVSSKASRYRIDYRKCTVTTCNEAITTRLS